MNVEMDFKQFKEYGYDSEIVLPHQSPSLLLASSGCMKQPAPP